MTSKNSKAPISYAESIYNNIKKHKKLDVKKHSIEIIEIFSKQGTLADFLVKAGISRQKFVAWQAESEVFREASLVAKEIARKEWLKIGIENADNREFNTKVWETYGRHNFGGNDKISLQLKPGATPLEHYQQIMEQATGGDFTSSEIKQLMESINIGIRSFEICQLQDEINGLKEGLAKMEEREDEYQSSNPYTKTENKVALVG